MCYLNYREGNFTTNQKEVFLLDFNAANKTERLHE